MSSPASNPFALFADMLRQGLDSYVSTQKTLLDIASQQNAMWMNAIGQRPGASIPAGMSELAGMSTKAFLESQKMGLDIAVQQNKLALNLVKGMLGPARPYLDELANLLEQGTQAFVDAQKKLLELAGQQADAVMKAARESGAASPNPLAQMAELSRQTVDAFIEAQKQFLDMLSKQSAGAAPASQPAADFLNAARVGFQNYLDMQRQFLETATSKMSDPTVLNGLARQGVDAFINMQRSILTLLGQLPNSASKS